LNELDRDEETKLRPDDQEYTSSHDQVLALRARPVRAIQYCILCIPSRSEQGVSLGMNGNARVLLVVFGKGASKAPSWTCTINAVRLKRRRSIVS
jgi:hypothetical protein